MPLFEFVYDKRNRVGRLFRVGAKRRLVLEFTPPKGVGAVEAERASWLWSNGRAPKWLQKQLDKREEQAKKSPPRQRGAGGYQPGKSCVTLGREHEWENRGSYLKCLVCKATKTIRNESRGHRARVENL